MQIDGSGGTGGPRGRGRGRGNRGGYQGNRPSNNQYNQGWQQGGRGRGRGYWGGSTRGRSGRGRSGGGGGAGGAGGGQARPPLPEDVEFVSSLRGHTKKVTSILLDEASGSLFTGSHDGTVRVWSTSSGECTSVVEMGGEVDSLLLEEGFLFVGCKSSSGQGTIRVWKIATGEQHELTGHVGQVLCLAATNGLLFSGGQDQTLRVWAPNPQTGQFAPQAVLTEANGGHSTSVSCLCAAGPLLFSADFGGNIRVWDVAAGAVRQAVDGAHRGRHISAITDLLVWQGHLISAGLDGRVKVWEPASGATAASASSCLGGPAGAPVLNPEPTFVLPEDDGTGAAGTAGGSPANGRPSIQSRLGGHPGATPSPRARAGAPSPADLPGVLAIAGVADPLGRAVLMMSLNGERSVRLFELPSFGDRGTLADVANARALAGYAGAGLLFSGDERGHVRVWRWKQAHPSP